MSLATARQCRLRRACYQQLKHQHCFIAHASAIHIISKSTIPTPLLVHSKRTLFLGRGNAPQNTVKKPQCKSSVVSSIKDIPMPRAYNSWVTDCADILSLDDYQRINRVIQSLNERYNVEIAVVTVKDIKPNASAASPDQQSEAYSSTPTASTLRYFATDLFNHWRIGNRTLQNGVLIFVHLKLRRIEIITGTSLANKVLTGDWLARMQEQHMVPPMKSGQYSEGIVNGILALERRIAEVYEPDLPPPEHATKQLPVADEQRMIEPPPTGFSGGQAANDSEGFAPALRPLRVPFYRSPAFKFFLASVAAILGFNYCQQYQSPPTCASDGSEMKKVGELRRYVDCSQWVPPQSFVAPPPAQPQRATQFSAVQRRRRDDSYDDTVDGSGFSSTSDDSMRDVPSSGERSIEFGSDTGLPLGNAQDSIDLSDPCAAQSVLSDGEKTELRIGSSIFDIYRCVTCGSLAAQATTPSWGRSQYVPCTRCKFKTAETKQISLEPATRMSDGVEHLNVRCLHCGYNQTEYRRLPMALERGYYPAGSPQGASNSSSGGSFGGGSSSGTGAGSSF